VRSGSAGEHGGETRGEAVQTAVERQLLDAALAFYGAAGGIIEHAGLPRPRLRRDAAGFEAVRQAMAALEAGVVNAHEAGLDADRIAEIARIDAEMVALVLRRRGAAPSSAAE